MSENDKNEILPVQDKDIARSIVRNCAFFLLEHPVNKRAFVLSSSMAGKTSAVFAKDVVEQGTRTSTVPTSTVEQDVERTCNGRTCTTVFVTKAVDCINKCYTATAIDFFEQALAAPICPVHVTSVRYRAHVIVNIGTAHYRHGNVREAWYAYMQSTRYLLSLQDVDTVWPDIVYTLSCVASVLFDLGEVKATTLVLNTILAISPCLAPGGQTLDILGNVGNTYVKFDRVC